MAVLAFTAALGYWAVEVQAFEAFYNYSRDHEDWQMDHVVMVALVFLMLAGSVTAAFATLFARRLAAATRARAQAEKRVLELRQQAAIGTLLGGMAHHINNHLQPVLLLTRMVQDNLAPESDDQKDLAVALQAAENASSVLKRIQKIANAEANTKDACQASASVQKAVTLAQAHLPSSVQVHASIAPLHGQLRMKPIDMETIVGHLVSNARDSLPPQGGVIRIDFSEVAQDTATGASRTCCLCVRDTGCGMTALELERVLDPFYTTKPQGRGMGLGLPETQALVEKAGGHMAITSTAGQGTEVLVTLPLH